MRKIAIVGSGNAGSITALNFGYYGGKYGTNEFEIDMYHDPNCPIEKVGQSTTPDVLQLVSSSLNMDWWNNDIGATLKLGILYENWGKKQKHIYHKFFMDSIACHFQTHKLSEKVRKSQYVNVVEKAIEDPESEIDADYIFDCRGKHYNNWDNYDTLINPHNSAIIAFTDGADPDLRDTKCVATPHGWTFVIPNDDSISYGYLYNNTITTDEEAREDFLDRFDVTEDDIDDVLRFRNYICKSMFFGERTILNGNRFAFLEPLEATSTTFYRNVAGHAWDYIVNGKSKKAQDASIRAIMKQLETFILWHYQYGSQFETPFWDYAKTLPFNPDDQFVKYHTQAVAHPYEVLNSKNLAGVEYGIWPRMSFKQWHDGVNS